MTPPKTVDEADGPQPNNHKRVCHDTLPWLISVSLDGMLRSALFLLMTVLAGCVTKPSLETEPYVKLSERETFDLLEAAFRHRLLESPLPRHAHCYVLIYNTDVPLTRFASRFPEYHIVVRSGWGSAPATPSRCLWLGLTTSHFAVVLVFDSAGGMEYRMQLQQGKWIVTSEKPSEGIVI